MILLSTEQISQWCDEHGAILSMSDSTVMNIELTQSMGKPIEVMLPPEALRIITLSIALTQPHYFIDSEEWLLVISELGIWSEAFEAIGMDILKSLLPGWRDKQPMTDIPGCLYKQADRLNLQAILFVIMAFQWDAYLLVDTKAFLIKISHDGYIHCWAANEENRSTISMLLSDFIK